MRIAVISDIHGNAIGLETALADIDQRGVDQIVCLGDAIQGGPQPAEVVARLRELQIPVVMGNADDWLLTGVDDGSENFSEERQRMMEAVREWQLSKLSDADRAFIAAFQPTIDIMMEYEQTLRCYHGSPKSFNDIILPQTPDEDVRRWLEPNDWFIYTGGHTHMQFIRHLGRTFHFNPGSVGFPYRHDQGDQGFRLDAWAEYAILTVAGDDISLEFRRLHYDPADLIAIYRASGRPYADQMIAQYGGDATG